MSARWLSCGGWRTGLAALIMGAISGCGGGGGSRQVPAGNTTELGYGSGIGLQRIGNPSDFETNEYLTSGALDRSGAAALYSVGGTGRDRVVAVIDTGIDTDHPELVGNLGAASIDIHDRSVEDGWDHGTMVAGLIAAARDGEGMHGLAFDAEIMSIRADSHGSCPSSCSFDELELADATRYATARQADVINFSLGSAEALDPAFAQSLEQAVAAGQILVFAAGNDGQAQPNFPGRFAAAPEALGQAIVVGSVDGDNRLSDFSNRAGEARSAYLVAPGENIRTTVPGGGTALVDGTSFAAPTVSAAAAALWSAAPHLSAEQLVEILLTTATDLGAAGVDEVYGWGLLNLQAAAAPQGDLVLPAGTRIDQDGDTVAGSRLTMAGPLGGAVIEQPMPAMTLDRYGRPYQVRIDDMITGAHRPLDLAPLLAARDDSRHEQTLDGTQLRLSSVHGAAGPAQLTLSAALSDHHRLELFAGKAAVNQSTADRPVFLMQQSGLLPFMGEALTPASERAGVRLLGQAGGGWRWHGMTSFGQTAEGEEFAATMLGLGRATAQGGDMELVLGQRLSANGVFETDGRGALAQAGWHVAHHIGIEASHPVHPRASLFATAALGRIAPPDEGMVSIDDYWANSWSFGIQGHSALFANDRLALAVAQPLRAINPGLSADLPTARAITGDIQRQRTKHRLVMQGREIDVELAYRTAINAQRQFGFNLLYRRQPGHSAQRPDEMIGTATMRLAF